MSHPSSNRFQGPSSIITSMTGGKYPSNPERDSAGIKKIHSSCSDTRRSDLKIVYDSLEDQRKDYTSLQTPSSDFCNPERCINQITEDDFRIFNSGSDNRVNFNVYQLGITCPMCLGSNLSSTTCLSSLGLCYLNPYLETRGCGLCASGSFYTGRSRTLPHNSRNENGSLPVQKNYKNRGRILGFTTIVSRLLLSMAVLTSLTSSIAFAMSPPPNYSQSNMPSTNFTCTDKATGGYYADPEAHCQMFHVCVRISDEEMKDFRFLCPHDTVFDQQNFICTNWWEIDCERSTRFYNKNDLFKEAGNVTDYDYGTPAPEYYEEYVYEYVDDEITTTPTIAKSTTPVAVVISSDSRHRLNLGKSAQHGQNRQGKSEDFDTSTVKSTAVKSTSTVTITSESISSSTKQPSFFSTSEKIPPKTQSTEGSTTTTTPIITTHRPTHHVTFQHVSPVGRTTAPPGIYLNSRGRSRHISESKPKLAYSPEEDKNLNYDSEDPFSVYDWRRDSTGVTASARTRYEALFGGASSRGRQNSEIRQDEEHVPKNPPPAKAFESPTTVVTAPEVSARPARARKAPEGNTDPNDQTQAKHKEFSNFRFYKTAFGRSYSSDDYFGNQATSSTEKARVSEPVKIGSRITRYSIYA